MAEFIIKDIVQNFCIFEFYRAHTLYYSVMYEGVKYMFPVDIEDVGGGTLDRSVKGITMMRWIRKGIDTGTFVKYHE